ncbi:MAG: SDR family NAD(P)-dependent oxidoreductase [Myxococcaceae bacterium]|nr:SDR family NAD(P)-dependent oxidoreductase [Myxococcaceae bacterium]
MTTTKTAVVTGGTSGLGEAAALALGRAGWRVLVVGRDAERGAKVAAQAGNGSEFVQGDLFSLDDVRRLASELARRAPALDLLVNNAGGVFSAGAPTVDGLERTFALNVAAPFVLTNELVEPLATAQGRVVNVVTGIMHGFKTTLEQLAGPKASGGMMAYVRTKLALIALTRQQQHRLGARGITFVALHPGIIPTTRFGHTMTGLNPFTTVAPFFAKVFRLGVTEAVAAARYVKVGTEAVEPGSYYYEGVVRPAPALAADEAFSSAVWSLVEQQTTPARRAAA